MIKDYKLSEIKEICEQYVICKSTCKLNVGKGCAIKKLLEQYPSEWKIEGKTENETIND